jgi:hypothetical protein
VEHPKRDWPWHAEPDWSAYRMRLRKLLKLAGRDSRYAYLAPGIILRYNWHPFRRSDRQKLGRAKYAYTHKTEIDPYPIVVDRENGETNVLVTPPTMPAFMPFLTIRLPLNDFNMRDIRPLMRVIDQAIRTALKNRPSLSEAPKMVPGIPSQRRFLLHCRDTEFDRDLERYRLHFEHGLTFRQVALMEFMASKGKTIGPNEARERRARTQVPGESSVRIAITRLYEAAYLKKYQARRRRLDAPAASIAAYWCDEHGRDCPATCKFMRQWEKQVAATLPKDTTGKSSRDGRARLRS